MNRSLSINRIRYCNSYNNSINLSRSISNINQSKSSFEAAATAAITAKSSSPPIKSVTTNKSKSNTTIKPPIKYTNQSSLILHNNYPILTESELLLLVGDYFQSPLNKLQPILREVLFNLNQLLLFDNLLSYSALIQYQLIRIYCKLNQFPIGLELYMKIIMNNPIKPSTPKLLPIEYNHNILHLILIEYSNKSLYNSFNPNIELIFNRLIYLHFIALEYNNKLSNTDTTTPPLPLLNLPFLLLYFRYCLKFHQYQLIFKLYKIMNYNTNNPYTDRDRNYNSNKHKLLISPSIEVYEILLYSCFLSLNESAAADYYRQLKNNINTQLQPKLILTEYIYINLIQLYGSLNNFTMIDTILLEMQRDSPNIIPSTKLGLIIIHYCTLYKQSQLALNYYTTWCKLYSNNPIFLTVEYYNSLINCCLINNDYSSAYNLLLEMHNKSINTDSITYNTLLNGLKSTGNINEIKSLINEMINDSIEPNQYTLTIALTACNKAIVNYRNNNNNNNTDNNNNNNSNPSLSEIIIYAESLVNLLLIMRASSSSDRIIEESKPITKHYQINQKYNNKLKQSSTTAAVDNNNNNKINDSNATNAILCQYYIYSNQYSRLTELINELSNKSILNINLFNQFLYSLYLIKSDLSIVESFINSIVIQYKLIFNIQTYDYLILIYSSSLNNNNQLSIVIQLFKTFIKQHTINNTIQSSPSPALIFDSSIKSSYISIDYKLKENKLFGALLRAIFINTSKITYNNNNNSNTDIDSINNSIEYLQSIELLLIENQLNFHYTITYTYIHLIKTDLKKLNYWATEDELIVNSIKIPSPAADRNNNNTKSRFNKIESSIILLAQNRIKLLKQSAEIIKQKNQQQQQQQQLTL